ncbi:MAG: OmpA family protein [Sedimentisphaerales bacterium]|nr:OmpA family protein [Sedimentisphaerales bacterium]
MRTVKLSIIFLLGFSFLLLNGCGTELQDLKIQNNTQRERIAQLESELQTITLQHDQLKRKLAAAQGSSGIEIQTLQQEIAALEEDIAKKKELIASMQERLLLGGAALPVELSTLLEDFAAKNDIVDYDSARGMVKFKSDLLFEKGSDTVAATAIQSIKSLCEILNSQEAKNFDVIIAGHTDDIPIGKPETRAKHPTNWHLSVHRAIAVLNVMAGNKVDYKRMSVRGFGEYRPIAENKPEQKGNPQNRRVEIYIVAKGV